MFNHSVVSDFLQPHGLQHARLPCPSPSPGACSNSCPLSRWCHPTIPSSVTPFFSCLQPFPASGSCDTSSLRKVYLFQLKARDLDSSSGGCINSGLMLTVGQVQLRIFPFFLFVLSSSPVSHTFFFCPLKETWQIPLSSIWRDTALVTLSNL